MVFANFPTANVRVADGIKSPLTREFTLGVGRELGSRGHAKATYAWRTTSNFVEDFVDLTHGHHDGAARGHAREQGVSTTPTRSTATTRR